MKYTMPFNLKGLTCIKGRQVVAVMAASMLLAISSGSNAAAIANVSFFNATDTLINFDAIPGVAAIPGNGQALFADFSSLGVASFRSESVVGASQATDPTDATGRFGATMFFYPALAGGGAPHSSPRYVTGLRFSGINTSDMRIDFVNPVSALGLWVIDNDASTARLQAYDATGVLIETRLVPQVGEGGKAFHGIDALSSGRTISYVILDGNSGAALDSSFIDNLYLRVAVVPEPEGWALMLTGLAAVLSVARRRRV